MAKKQLDHRVYSAIFVFLVTMLNAVVLLDIPIARQIVGFIFLTFVPGISILQLLGPNGLSKYEKLVLSVGLSIASLMIFGLFLNEFSFMMGYSRPLQTMPLLVLLDGFAVLCGVVSFERKIVINWDSKSLRQYLLRLFPSVLPILGVLGALLMNVYGSNTISVILLVMIAALVTVLMFKKVVSTNVYTVTLFAIALAVLYNSSLISSFIVSFGSDSHIEFLVFRTVQANQYWNSASTYGSLVVGRVYSMLSVTVLPAVYVSLLNLDQTLLFKTLYPFVFAMVPICLYQLWQKYVGVKYGFIAAFLLIAQATFYTEMLGLNRQIIAELFFALLLIVLLNKKIDSLSKMLLFTVFSFCLVASHYGLSVIFLSFVVAVFAYSYIVKRTVSKITVYEMLTFSVLMFAWYIFTSGSSSFQSILGFSNYVLSQLGSFFNPASRGQMVLLGLGLQGSPTLWNAISRGFAYATEFLIVIGFVGLVKEKNRIGFDRDYLVFTYIAVVLLGILIIVPGLANTLNMTRFYHVLLFFLAPLAILGGDYVARLLFKNKAGGKALILLLVILVPYFLFQTSLAFEISKTDTFSMPLSKYRMSNSRLYIDLQYMDGMQVSGALWLRSFFDYNRIYVYADGSVNALTGYGMLPLDRFSYLSDTTQFDPNYYGSLIFLSYLDIAEGNSMGDSGFALDSSTLSLTIDMNKIFTDGGGEIFSSVNKTIGP